LSRRCPPAWPGLSDRCPHSRCEALAVASLVGAALVTPSTYIVGMFFPGCYPLFSGNRKLSGLQGGEQPPIRDRSALRPGLPQPRRYLVSASRDLGRVISAVRSALRASWYSHAAVVM
jgi:hypothetical protein